MAKDDIKVTSTAKKVSNEKTEQQAKEAAATKERMAKANKEAEEARKKANTKTTTSKSTSSKSSSMDSSDLLEAGAGLATSLLKNTGKGSKNGGGFTKGIIVGLIIGVLVTGILGFAFKEQIFATLNTTKENADQLLDEGLLGYTAVDFQEAVLGACSEHQELIVMEQPLEITTTVTKAGLGNLAIFSKVKTITYYGTGVYTVNMKDIDAAHIKVDETSKTVTIIIPHTVLQYVNPDLEKTEFEDTEKGLLAFGDLALTTEQQNELSKSVNNAMRERLDSADLYTQADDYAKMKTWEMFQPLITAVSPEYKVEMEFSK